MEINPDKCPAVEHNVHACGYLFNRSTSMKKQVTSTVPTEYGVFQFHAFAQSDEEDMPYLALVSGDLDDKENVLVRLHSECLTGDIFHSHRCDCGEQLHRALEEISDKGGVLIYMRQEGRGIGLINKLRAYNLQDEGLNTKDANIHLGFQADERSYEIAVDILEELGIESIRLLTNNPEKIKAFEHSSIDILERVPLIIPPRSENEEYLKTKKQLMGHLLDPFQ